MELSILNQRKEILITQKDIENFKKVANKNIFKEKIYFRFFKDGEIIFFNLTSAKIFIKKIILLKNLNKWTRVKHLECKEIKFKTDLEIPPSTYDQIYIKKSIFR